MLRADLRFQPLMKRLQAGLYCRIQDPTLSAVSNAPVAQWIEHLTTDQKVTGSSPVGRTIQSLLDPEPTKMEATG